MVVIVNKVYFLISFPTQSLNNRLKEVIAPRMSQNAIRNNTDLAPPLVQRQNGQWIKTKNEKYLSISAGHNSLLQVYRC